MERMKIREAVLGDYAELMDFYTYMCTVLDGKDFLPHGNKGGFPSAEMVSDAIKDQNLFVEIEDDKIVGAIIMNHECDEAYHTVSWGIDAPDDQVVILHALRILPKYSGQGYAKKLIQYSIEKAKKRNLKAIHLDVIEGNDIPLRMYGSFGFQYVDTVEMCYKDIGEARKFHLMELLLC